MHVPADHKDIAFVDHDIFRKSGCAVVVGSLSDPSGNALRAFLFFLGFLGETCCELVQNRYRMEARGGRAREGP